jgi:threonine dehydratase
MNLRNTLTGLYKVFKNIFIQGVESERCPSWQSRRIIGKHTKCQWSQWGAKNSIADGLAVAEVGCNAFATCDHQLEKVVSISEDWVRPYFFRNLIIKLMSRLVKARTFAMNFHHLFA